MTATLQPLTDRQREVLDFIRDYIAENGFGPSYREMAHAVGMESMGSVRWDLNALESAGLVALANTKQARSVRLTEKRRCPHCGKEID